MGSNFLAQGRVKKFHHGGKGWRSCDTDIKLGIGVFASNFYCDLDALNQNSRIRCVNTNVFARGYRLKSFQSCFG